MDGMFDKCVFVCMYIHHRRVLVVCFFSVNHRATAVQSGAPCWHDLSRCHFASSLLSADDTRVTPAGLSFVVVTFTFRFLPSLFFAIYRTVELGGEDGQAGATARAGQRLDERTGETREQATCMCSCIEVKLKCTAKAPGR